MKRKSFHDSNPPPANDADHNDRTFPKVAPHKKHSTQLLKVPQVVPKHFVAKYFLSIENLVLRLTNFGIPVTNNLQPTLLRFQVLKLTNPGIPVPTNHPKSISLFLRLFLIAQSQGIFFPLETNYEISQIAETQFPQTTCNPIF